MRGVKGEVLFTMLVQKGVARYARMRRLCKRMGLAIMKRCCTLLLVISLAVTCCESQPTFSSSSYVTTVSELTPVGSTIINVTATTGSPGNSLTYNIFNHPPSILDIDSSTGSVILIGSLDYEQEATFTFNVEVIEDMGVVMTPVTVNIANANDEVPLCSATIYTITIAENSAVGSHLLSLSCSDSDGDSLEYSLEGDSENIFQLDTLTTSLSLAAPVDSEAASTHNVLVNVFDGEHSVQLKVYVYVEPSNEHVPRFNQTVYDCSVAESAAIGSIFCWVFAEDEDSGQDGQLSYAITSGNEANKFGIDSTTGEIVLTGYIDYESVQGYLIFVRVTDNGESPLGNSVQVRITVLDSNDNAPIVNPLITAVIAENSALGSVVKVLECSDADSGINRDVELIIDSQTNAAGDSVAAFSIGPSTNELITDSNIDYEESSFFTIALTCRDNGSPSLSSSSTIIVGVSPVNEFAPVLIQDNYSATIAENSTVGTSVLEVTAMDGDTGPDGNVVFTIQAEGRDFLQISETSGIITTQQLMNCDWGQEHSFTISAADRGTPPLISQSLLTVRLDNCRLGQLTPGETVYFASIVENSPVDTEVVRIACDFDRVSHGNPEYIITSPSSTPFQVDPVSGVISIATPPDYEQASSHMLQVICTDPSDAESYTIFSVYVTVTPENEHSPEFTVAVYETEISEAVFPGTSVLQVEAVDEDSGADGSVVYSIQEEMQDFVIDSNTGIVYTLGHLDRERETLHSFHVLAVDGMGEGESTKSSVAEIRVSIADSNDNSPECDKTVYHITLSPLLEAGEKILSLDCKDADIGSNSQLHYSLHHQSSDTLDQFAISEDTGDLVLARKFGPESGVIHEIIATIEDHGEPPRSTVALVVVDLETSPADSSGTTAEAEGSKNTVTFTMRDMSLNLWDAGGRESFQEAVAHSITTHCALLPDTCSLLSGCHHFYTRRRRAADEYFIAIFTENNVVILPESIKEFSRPDGITYLNITFYITLPHGAERSGYRTTDYVIPRTTLILLVRDEGPVIESQVRGRVAPSLTQQSSTEEDSSQNWTWGVVTLALVMTCVCIALLTCFILEKLKSAKKQLTIAPINVPVSLTLHQKSCPKPTAPSHTSGVVSPGGNSKKKRLLLRDLLRSPIVSDDDDDGDAGQGRLSPQSEQDDISTIHLVAEEPNESSLQGQPRSQGSLDLSSAVSGNSARNSQKSGSGSSSVGDYKQNFPYEPPRQSRGHNLHQSGPRPGAPAFAHVRKNLQPWK